MAKVILICGKICSGKTFYANNLKILNKAVCLSSDELISDLFHPNENDYHDKIINKVHDYLIKKSIEIVKNGINVILDWGFWTKNNREFITNLYKNAEIDIEWHYIDIIDSLWKLNIEKRNAEVLSGKSKDYFVDESLLKKMNNFFDIPTRDEIDVWVKYDNR